ncbi:triosephosphate isomerase [Candidatus Curtissbacteria bacterium]|nr:triosephosphate isomerase [Candidatus Curtissbacteria bacterium]
MKNFMLVANWKANLTVDQASDWFTNISDSSLEIVVCPSFPVLGAIANLPVSGNISLGAQDVSVKTIGAFTGQVPAEIIQGLAKYSLVGHSETRRLFGVTAEDIQLKVENLRGQNIHPIVCGNYSELTTERLGDYSDLVLAFEPEESISTNPGAQPLTGKVASEKITKIKEITGCQTVLYGGSVTVENIKDFFDAENIDGALVGKASTDINLFNQIINLCK